MNALTLQWYDAGQAKTQKIHEHQPSKNLGTIRIGRDPLRCDIVLSNPTVSGLHIEIFFNSQQQRFLIRNLREQNPPLIDGHKLTQGEMPLGEGSTIYLGQQQLKVIAISIPSASSVPPTILTPPQPVTPIAKPQPQVNPGYHLPIPPTPPQGIYGLQCPKCQKISSYNDLLLGCHHCGHSLQDAQSVLVPPTNY
ncbi:FHA domain-containing protein [Chlorogloeopsis sp. ULAP01]|uniref:FHA domain-containing protein n=1 Tax=Chlorogloeopsis sp. ULAP01 TaxID=3056483 RepID=UPI0025AA4C01|nr:FHA domain-containing protein [Chlorogloeopsis sp. ULAP01]MDM9382186.1 FHA domain-containing protein [Chlorogloeopsis sp. ULAP01]